MNVHECACSVHLEVGVLPVCFFLGHFSKNVQCIYRCVHQKMDNHWKLKVCHWTTIMKLIRYFLV